MDDRTILRGLPILQTPQSKVVMPHILGRMQADDEMIVRMARGNLGSGRNEFTHIGEDG